MFMVSASNMPKVETYIQPDLPDVYGDHHRLIEVMQNLIDNATKYMGGKTAPYIEIGLKGRENDRLVFFIKDNGMGIAPDHYELIFGLFNKLDAKSEGTGVGFALVKRSLKLTVAVSGWNQK